MGVVHGHPRPGNDVIIEQAVRRHGPEGKDELRRSPVGPARIAVAEGRVHGSPIGIGHVIAGLPVGDGETAWVILLDLVEGNGARMEEAEVGCVDVPFEGLQVVAFPLGEHQPVLVFTQQGAFQERLRRDVLPVPHEHPDQAVAFEGLVGPGADLVLEILLRRHIGHVDAGAVQIILPAVIDAPEAGLFIAAEEQRGAPVRTPVIHDPHPAVGRAKSDQPLVEQHEADGIAAGHEFARFGRRYPVLAEQLAHGRAGAHPGQDFAFRFGRHRHPAGNFAEPEPRPVAYAAV